MRTVHKFPLNLVDEPQRLLVSAPGTVVHVAGQHDLPTLWIEVDTDRSASPRTFTVEGTGHPIPDDHEYVGTAHTHGGMMVWHIYEDPRGR